MAEIYEMPPEKIVGIERFQSNGGAETWRAEARSKATAVFAQLAKHCAEQGVLADLTRAKWFVDYDISMMVDRVIVQAPFTGRGLRPLSNIMVSGTFDDRMQAVGNG